MSDPVLTQHRIAAVTAYFHKIDRGDPSILDIMTDDVEIYFPKFGVGHGKNDFMEVARGLMGSLERICHDVDRMTMHVAGDHVIVEGFESGVMADGTAWPVKGRSEGRFSNVFAFKGELIKRIAIYVDPDFQSTHTERFLWGENVRMAGA